MFTIILSAAMMAFNLFAITSSNKWQHRLVFSLFFFGWTMGLFFATQALLSN